MNNLSSVFGESLLANPEKSGLALESRLGDLRTEIRKQSPSLLAERTLIELILNQPNDGSFSLALLNDPVKIPFPELDACDPSGNPLSPVKQGLLMYHLFHSDGYPVTGKWLSFSEIPGGRTYAQAFQGYSGDRIATVVGSDLPLFTDACVKTAGQPSGFGDSSFIFQALPRVPLLIVYHCGDDEFPSSCRVLFDASVPHHLPVDACAILGSMLTSRIIGAINSTKKEN
jgi:hypothetical protein